MNNRVKRCLELNKIVIYATSAKSTYFFTQIKVVLQDRRWSLTVSAKNNFFMDSIQHL